jgi:sulfonate transport system permease protein
MQKSRQLFLSVLGIVLGPLIWVTFSVWFPVSERYLPSPASVYDAFVTVRPSIFVHFGWSLGRLLIGFGGGIAIGLALGLLLYKSKSLKLILYPTIQSIRSVPAAATIPFFLLWFGFAETGKFLLIFLGVAFNLAITTAEILNRIPEKYHIMFAGFKSRPENHLSSFALPFVLEKILPTLRFSLSTSIGLVVISEMLGSQVGLGYVIDTARSTFSMNVVFAVVILFGIMNFLMDRLLVVIWKKLIYWKI